ncbi:hypothetical protein JX266_002166 [Neoarthrinium moseri]|nr:hypothetical protein JX266_002166 [Neoarthrinium moseri]
MEHIIKTFMRVLRKMDDADTLIAQFPELERIALSEPAAITDQDRRRLLDLPELDIQTANLAAVTELDKAQLLERAAKSPDALTDAEIDLLWHRFWHDVTDDEALAAEKACEAIGHDEWDELADRLARAREPLYEEHELVAFQNAPKELTWRITADFRARRQKELERALGNAAQWIVRIWEEDLRDRPGARCGYATFLDPSVKAEMGAEDYDDYDCRADGALLWAKMSIRGADAINPRWLMQRLEWPTDLVTSGETAEEGREDLTTTFQRLRESFRSVRDRPPKEALSAKGSGLVEGLLRNVFLVVDRDAVKSVSKHTRSVDDMWVWAIDPDFEPNTTPSSGEGVKSDRYQGYMRVRLQQLVKNFYEMRRWHADEFSMQALWEAAQLSRDQLFVSVHEDEAKQWTLSRDVGSAIRQV